MIKISVEMTDRVEMEGVEGKITGSQVIIWCDGSKSGRVDYVGFDDGGRTSVFT